MSELACNLVIYRPDPAVLAARFRYWHVETLLEQAGALIDRCLAEQHNYSALDYAWHELESDLEAQEQKLGMYQQAAGQEVLEREVSPPREGGEEAAVSLEGSETADQADEAPRGTEEPAEPRGLKSSIDYRADALRRKRALSGAGGPFALYEQRDLALKRLCRDYEEAVNRACVAEEGLKRLYDHVVEPGPLPTEAEQLGTSITALAIWIRNSQEFLARYRLREQAFTRAVSVRSLLNRNAWGLLRHARDSYVIKLHVPVDLFRDHDNCRIRGVAAYLVGEAGTVPWSLTVRLPDEAVYERFGHSIEVDQTSRAVCLLGRVENRRSVRTPELCGAMTLLDASPVGRATQGGLWSLEIFKPMGASSETFAHVEDLVLEIHTVGIPH